MKLIKDLWEHILEWSEWSIKDWIKAGIVSVVVLYIVSQMLGSSA